MLRVSTNEYHQDDSNRCGPFAIYYSVQLSLSVAPNSLRNLPGECLDTAMNRLRQVILNVVNRAARRAEPRKRSSGSSKSGAKRKAKKMAKKS